MKLRIPKPKNSIEWMVIGHILLSIGIIIWFMKNSKQDLVRIQIILMAIVIMLGYVTSKKLEKKKMQEKESELFKLKDIGEENGRN